MITINSEKRKKKLLRHCPLQKTNNENESLTKACLAFSRLSVSRDDRKSGRATSGIRDERDPGGGKGISPFSLPDPARRRRLFRSCPLTESLEQEQTPVCPILVKALESNTLKDYLHSQQNFLASLDFAIKL